MKITYLFFLLIGSFPLIACHTRSVPRGEIVSVSRVLSQIKTDIATHNAYSQVHSNDRPVGNCKSTINFAIQKVEVQLVTKSDSTTGGGAGVVIPISEIEAGAEIKQSSETKNSRTISFNLYHFGSRSFTAEEDDDDKIPPRNFDNINFEQFPITSSLKELREGLIEGSKNTKAGPCLALSDSAGTANKLEYAITAIEKTTGSSDFKFSIVSVSAARGRESTYGNLVTVTFVATIGSVANSSGPREITGR